MCFSAVASFAASSVLAVVGVATVRVTKDPRQKLFASIPLLFAIQQVVEGFVWFSLQNEQYFWLEGFSVHVFLFFAQVVWPFFVPFSFLLMEKNEKRKRILFVLTLVGAIVAGYLGICLSLYDVQASVESFHIKYDLFFPAFNLNYKGILYFVATVIPAFVSSVKWVNFFGIGILASFLVTEVFYANYLVSVWCFFAAVLSILIYFIMRSQGNSQVEIK